MLYVFSQKKILRWVPKDMRKNGVLESLKDQNVAAIVEEADYVENSGYYDQDGNWVYYEGYEENAQISASASQQKPTEPKPATTTQPQPKPVQNGLKPAQNGTAQQNAQKAQAEAAQAAQEAAAAAQEAAQAAKGLMKGISGFGKSSGFSLGGLMKTVSNEVPKPTAQQPKKAPAEPPKPKVKPQNPNFPKPCTNNMTAKQRWHWAHRRIVQVHLVQHPKCSNYSTLFWNYYACINLYFEHFYLDAIIA